MKYIVRKEMPGAKVGDILEENGGGALCKYGNTRLTSFVHIDLIQDALDQGFIEPYEEKAKGWVPSTGEHFWFIRPNGSVYDATAYVNGKFYFENNTYHNVSYVPVFKSKETAEAVAEALKLFFEYLHTPIDYDRHVTAEKDMLGAFNRARELVLADNEVSNE